MPSAQPSATSEPTASSAPCPLFHDAVELIGRRWTGAILAVLLQHGPLRFGQIAQAVPDLSDRLLAQRMRELEARGLVTRTELPVGVEYALTEMGRDLEAAIGELRGWARRWLR
jgi:DNA-binding HxlR family transcriptional regulator